MKVRKLRWMGGAIALVAAIGSVASAAGQRPSQQTLRAMGLDGLVVMSDDEALAIRGEGFGSTAQAWGNSWAYVSVHGASAGSTNGYQAQGQHEASGANISFAGVIVEHSGGKGGHGDKGEHGGKGDRILREVELILTRTDVILQEERRGGWGDSGGHSDKHGNTKGGGHSDKHGNTKGGSYKGDKGGHKGDKGGGHKGGGKPQVKSITVFAGGASSAKVK